MQDQLLGYQLGNYRLVQVLGQGSFAQVYRGQHIHLGVFTAVKVMHAQLGEQEKQNFHKEAVLLTTLKHQHIIRFLDYGFISGRPYLITDLAERGSLNKLHPRGTRLPMSQISAYVAQIAEGLDFAHSQHIVHRDIKPENILVGDTGELLLADFGIAKLVSNTGSYMTSNMSGTLPYMAPELFDGRPSPPSDQYALGVMVYEWLTGRFPFEGTAGELIKHHLQDQPPPLRTFNPAVSVEIEEVVMMALQKDPARRFRTMRAFANALRQAGEPYAAGKQPSQPMPQIRPPVPSDPVRQPQQQPNPIYTPAPTPYRPPTPSDPRVGQPQTPLPPRVVNPVSDPQVRPPVSSDPAARVDQFVGAAPIQTQPTADPMDWQQLMPPPRALTFAELPGLPQAQLTDYWWPTFIVATEQRRKINEGTITSETLSILGPLASFPSLSVPLPVSNSAKPLSIGRLDAAQRISTGAHIPGLAPIRPAGAAPTPVGTGRVSPALGPQQAGQVQIGVPQPTGRIAQPVKAGGQGASTSSGASKAGSAGGAAGALVFTILTLFISIICTVSASSQHASGALGASWVFLIISFIICVSGMVSAKQYKGLRGWLTFFLIVLIVMAFINFGVYGSVSSY